MNKYVFLIVSWESASQWEEEDEDTAEATLLKHLSDPDTCVAHWIIEAPDDKTAWLIGKGHAFDEEFQYSESNSALFHFEDPKIQQALSLMKVQETLGE
jgi:microcompartment protein CcmL/EutN